MKCPRFAFEQFATANPQLTTQMKSVGESMAIGRTFQEAFQKALRALEVGRAGWTVGAIPQDDRLLDESVESLKGALRQPTPERVFQLKRGIEAGMSSGTLHELTGIDPGSWIRCRSSSPRSGHLKARQKLTARRSTG